MGARERNICRSNATSDKTAGRWTFTATSSPEVRRVPRYTCPMLALATGSKLNFEKVLSIVMFSSRSMTYRPNSALKGGTASCRPVSPFAYFAGSKSVRVLRAWPILICHGPWFVCVACLCCALCLLILHASRITHHDGVFNVK